MIEMYWSAQFAGHSQRFDDLPRKLNTDRGPVETWFTFSYSRILDPQGEIAVVFIFTNETTQCVLTDAPWKATATARSPRPML